MLTFAMETMHFFHCAMSLSLRTKIICISGVPMNDLTPMKNCPGYVKLAPWVLRLCAVFSKENVSATYARTDLRISSNGCHSGHIF